MSDRIDVSPHVVHIHAEDEASSPRVVRQREDGMMQRATRPGVADASPSPSSQRGLDEVSPRGGPQHSVGMGMGMGMGTLGCRAKLAAAEAELAAVSFAMRALLAAQRESVDEAVRAVSLDECHVGTCQAVQFPPLSTDVSVCGDGHGECELVRTVRTSVRALTEADAASFAMLQRLHANASHGPMVHPIGWNEAAHTSAVGLTLASTGVRDPLPTFDSENDSWASRPTNPSAETLRVAKHHVDDENDRGKVPRVPLGRVPPNVSNNIHRSLNSNSNSGHNSSSSASRHHSMAPRGIGESKAAAMGAADGAHIGAWTSSFATPAASAAYPNRRGDAAAASPLCEVKRAATARRAIVAGYVDEEEAVAAGGRVSPRLRRSRWGVDVLRSAEDLLSA